MATIQDFRRPEIEAGETPAAALQLKPDERKGGFRISFFFRFRIKATKPRKVRIEGGAPQIRAIHALEAHEERDFETASQDDKEESTWGFGGEVGVYCQTPPDTGEGPLG